MSAAVDMTPGTASWASRLTASRFGMLFGGPGSWRTLRRQMEAGEAGQGSTVTARSLEHGRENEPRAIALYEIETGRTVTRPGFVTLPGNPRIGATADGLIDEDGLLEIKCPLDEGKHLLARQGVFLEDYHWQVQGGLWVTNREWADFVSFSPFVPPSEALAIVRVPRDERAIGRLAETAFRFLAWLDESPDSPRYDFTTPGVSGVPKLF